MPSSPEIPFFGELFRTEKPGERPAAPLSTAKPTETEPAETKPAEANPTDSKQVGSEADSWFAKGREALFQGKSDKAIELLNKAVTADKSKTSYRLSLARAYRYAGEDEQAIANLEEILKTASDHVEAGQMLGELYTIAKRWKDVMRVLDPLLKYRHDYSQAYEMFTKIGPTVKEDKALFYYYYAQAAFGTGQYDRYLELLEEAIQLDPGAYKASRVDAYLSVADQYNEAGNLDRYIEYLGKAVGESPLTASLHLKLGNAYEEARRLDKAIEQWRIVLDIEPDHPQRTKLLNRIEKYTANLKVVVRPEQQNPKLPLKTEPAKETKPVTAKAPERKEPTIKEKMLEKK